MNWMWFAVVQDADAHDAFAAARASWSDGVPACVLAVWPPEHHPKGPTVKIDSPIIQRDGDGAEVSARLCLRKGCPVAHRSLG